MAAILSRLAKAGRRNELIWRYGFNLGPTVSYKLGGSRLDGAGRKVLADLNRDGIAITSVGELCDDSDLYTDLLESVSSLESRNADRIASTRAAAADDGLIGEKTFNLELLGGRPLLDTQCAYARFALQPSILQIANTYFRMYARLRYYNVWHTVATKAEARESQLWHRDREDQYILKVFVYCADVDEGAGPFTYAAGSHKKGPYHDMHPEYHLEGGVRRSSDEQMAAVVPREKWVKGTGQAGTIVFADTHGYHKGGFARERDRIMFTCMFTSPASQSKELFDSGKLTELPLDKAQRTALHLPIVRG